jgi:hypothetical protein
LRSSRQASPRSPSAARQRSREKNAKPPPLPTKKNPGSGLLSIQRPQLDRAAFELISRCHQEASPSRQRATRHTAGFVTDAAHANGGVEQVLAPFGSAAMDLIL